MAQVTKLSAAKRDASGSRAAGVMRRGGRIPVVLYGHKQDAVALSIDAHDFGAALDNNAQFVELETDGAPETAVIREVQYDTYGQNVLHVDFVRVDIDEPIVVPVAVELRGHPKGLSEGGVLERQMTDVKVRCSPRNMPERIEINIAELGLHDAVLLKDLPLPEGAEIVDDPEKPVCTVVAGRHEEEEAEPAVEAAEGPEVIGEKKDGDEGGES